MSIIERAKAELDAINFGDMDTAVMIKIIDLFFKQWDSGGAVDVAAPVLARLIAGKPLTPLTGKDDEWRIFDNGNGIYAQNIRCSTVFKNSKDGPAYDIEGDGPITFPYTP